MPDIETLLEQAFQQRQHDIPPGAGARIRLAPGPRTDIVMRSRAALAAGTALVALVAGVGAYALNRDPATPATVTTTTEGLRLGAYTLTNVPKGLNVSERPKARYSQGSGVSQSVVFTSKDGTQVGINYFRRLPGLTNYDPMKQRNTEVSGHRAFFHEQVPLPNGGNDNYLASVYWNPAPGEVFTVTAANTQSATGLKDLVLALANGVVRDEVLQQPELGDATVPASIVQLANGFANRFGTDTGLPDGQELQQARLLAVGDIGAPLLFMLGVNTGTQYCTISYVDASEPSGSPSCYPLDRKSSNTAIGVVRQSFNGTRLLWGSAPKGTVQIRLTAHGSTPKTILAFAGGAEFLDRSYFITGWSGDKFTTLQAIDANGKVIAQRRDGIDF